MKCHQMGPNSWIDPNYIAIKPHISTIIDRAVMCAMAGAHPAWDCSPMGPNTLEHQVASARRQAATPKMELEPYETKNGWS